MNKSATKLSYEPGFKPRPSQPHQALPKFRPTYFIKKLSVKKVLLNRFAQETNEV